MGHIVIEFLEAVFGTDTKGILITGRISGHSGPKGRGIDTPDYFLWPDQAEEIVAWHKEFQGKDLYYSPMLYKVRQRVKESVSHTPVIWCDADTAKPDTFKLPPSFYTETSPGRYHCYWVLDQEVTPQWAEQMSKLVAYSNLEEGSDKGGWALAKYLRLPGAKNTKQEYVDPLRPKRWVVKATYNGDIYSPDELIHAFGTPELNVLTSGSEVIPDDLPEKHTVLDKIMANSKLMDLLNRTPMSESWSEPLWFLECSLFRLGLTAPEVFVLVNGCACDKYTRMGRPPEHLWKEVRKADRMIAERGEMVFEMMIEEDPDKDMDQIPPPPGIELLTDDEKLNIPRTFIDEYCEWARQKTNADIHYHEFSAMALMSIVLGEFGHCEMSYGITKLNLWFMVLGVTTRTYKTTAKNLMLSVLRGIQSDRYNYDLGSDATTEGLLLELADRPKRSTVFHRDEAQGMLHASKGGKNYMVGFSETLTELYDGFVPGRLRATGKQKIAPTETNFCLYLAGVPEKLGEVLNDSDFESGFLARFLFTIGVPEPITHDTFTLRQPPRGVESTPNLAHGRELTALKQRLLDARKHWASVTTPGETVNLWLTPEALNKLNDANRKMMVAAIDSDSAKLMEPSANRMNKSILKLACLLAMMRQTDEVELQDMTAAIYYAENWYNTLAHMTTLVRQSSFSNQVAELVQYVRNRAAGKESINKGVSFARTRRRFDHLLPRQWADLVETAVDQGYIQVLHINSGKTKILRPVSEDV